MAVVNTKSNLITNADHVPVVLSDPHLGGGAVRSAVATIEIAAADDNGSVYRMIRISSGCRVNGLKVFCDAIVGGTSFTLGLYDTAGAGGAVVSGALFATAFDLSSAITSGTDVLFQNLGVEKIEKRVWELLGLSADPFKQYDICFVGTVVGSGAGTVSLMASFAI